MLYEMVAIAEEIRPGLQETLHSAVGHDFVHGASLEVDRYWLESFLARVAGRPNTLFSDPFRCWLSRHDPPKWDLDYRPDDWGEYCDRSGYGRYDNESPEPLLIRVFLDQRSVLGAGGTHSLLTNEPEWPQFYEGYPIIYEIAPPAVAASIRCLIHWPWSDAADLSPNLPAVSVGRVDPATAGTMTGALRDRTTGKLFGVGCAHVLGVDGTQVFCPGPYEGRAVRSIGQTRWHSIAQLRQESGPCNFESAPQAGRLDAALVEIDPTWADASDLSQPAAEELRSVKHMEPYNLVQINGKESGFVRAQIAGVGIWKRIWVPDFGTGFGGERCFGGVFGVMGLNGDLRPIGQGGDSGAWIIDFDGCSRRWNGIVIGVLGHRTVACFADYLLREAQSQFPHLGLT